MRQFLILILTCGVTLFSVFGVASAAPTDAAGHHMDHPCESCTTLMLSDLHLDHGPACAFMPGCIVATEPPTFFAPELAVSVIPVRWVEGDIRHPSQVHLLRTPPPRF